MVHDADLLGHLQARRRTTPLAFVVSTDSSLRVVWSKAMGPKAHGQPPATVLPAVASRLLAGLVLPVPVSPPWQERSDVWTLAVGYVARAVDLDEASVASLFDDQELLVPDQGLIDDDVPHPLCSRIHELVDDARLAVSAVVDVLEGAAADPAAPLAVAHATKASEDASDAGAGADPVARLRQPVGRVVRARRRLSLAVALVASLVFRTVVVPVPRLGRLLARHFRSLAAYQRLAVALGLVAWTAAGAQYSASGDESVFVFNVVVAALAVWSVAFVVFRPKR